MNSRIRNTRTVILIIIFLIVTLVITIKILYMQGLIIGKIFNPEITAAVGAILAGIFGPLVSMAAVFIYFQALRQDKEQFEKKIELSVYDRLYEILDEIDEYFSVKIPHHTMNRFQALQEHSETKSLEGSIGESIKLMRDQYHTFYRPALSKFKREMIKINRIEIRDNIELLYDFHHSKVTPLLANGMQRSVLIHKEAIQNYSKLSKETKTMIEKEINFGRNYTRSTHMTKKLEEFKFL